MTALEAFDRIRQRIDALFVEEQAGFFRHDGIAHTAAAEGDDGTARCIGLYGNDAEILLGREYQRPALGIGSSQFGKGQPLDDADTESFFDVSEPTDIDFKARYYERLVVVPRGGDSGTVVVKVVAK